MPNYPQTTPATMDIINRLTALPQYRQIGPGVSANGELLWQAVNQNAAGWVSKQGAAPAEGARWIDSLTFRSAADKADSCSTCGSGAAPDRRHHQQVAG